MKTIITMLLFIPLFSFGQITTYYLNQDSLPSDTLFSHQLLDIAKNFISDDQIWTTQSDIDLRIQKLEDEVNELKFQVQELAILLRQQLSKNPK